MGKFISMFDKILRIIAKKNYPREQLQTYMTGPEWRNVEMAEELADFVKNGNSIFYFPYFKQVGDLWRIVGKSYQAARTYNSHSKIWFGTDYMAMDLFIPFFTTLELAPKGVISLLLRPFVKKENNTEMQKCLAGYFERYANNLHTIPFYDHKYQEERDALRNAYQQCKNKTMTDRLSYYLVSIDLWARKWISKPLSYWFHTETNLVAPTTDILVKYNAKNIDDPEAAKQNFHNKLQQAQQIKDVMADIVNNEVYVKDKNPKKSYTSIYARLRVPRYDAFKPTMQALSEQGIAIKKIAGNDHVQVKCVVQANVKENLANHEQKLLTTPSANLLYAYSDRIYDNKKTMLFDVPVKNLQTTVNKLNECPGSTVKFIHNF